MQAPSEMSMPGPGHNRQWRLVEPIEPTQAISPDQFQLVESPIPTIGQDEVLIRTICLGTSPAQRAYISTSPSMHSKAEGGQVMRGRGAGVVVESASSRFQPGEIVVGPLGWQDYSVHRATAEGLLALEHWRSEVRPVALALGVLGSAGITAFFGLTDVGQIKAGDTVVVSAAAGGVGSCAVQIAGALDCRVVGIAGGKQKCHWLTERLKADAAINYQSGDLGASLDQACPHGIDVFFDNVGGEQLQLALERLALGARVVICGFISTDYERPDFGPSNYTYLLKRRARMEGFFVFDYQGRFHEAEAQLLDWYQAGRLTDTSDLLFGLENMPLALQSLFSGGNCGVRICQVSPDP